MKDKQHLSQHNVKDALTGAVAYIFQLCHKTCSCIQSRDRVIIYRLQRSCRGQGVGGSCSGNISQVQFYSSSTPPRLAPSQQGNPSSCLYQMLEEKPAPQDHRVKFKLNKGDKQGLVSWVQYCPAVPESRDVFVRLSWFSDYVCLCLFTCSLDFQTLCGQNFVQVYISALSSKQEYGFVLILWM